MRETFQTQTRMTMNQGQDAQRLKHNRNHIALFGNCDLKINIINLEY